MHYIVQQAHFYETKCKVNISSIYRITMSNSINLNCQDSAKHPLLSHWGNTTEIWEIDRGKLRERTVQDLLGRSLGPPNDGFDIFNGNC